MSKSQHTPGPWSFSSEGHGSFYIRDNNGHQLIWLGHSSQFDDGENEANARLIAAAPDFLVSAQALVDRWETPMWKDASHTAKYIDDLKKAINKATGKEVTL